MIIRSVELIKGKQIGGIVLVKYCDWCKWDDTYGSWPNEASPTHCPKCGTELWTVDSLEDIH